MRNVWKNRIKALERRICDFERERIFARKEFGYEEVLGDDGDGSQWKPRQFEGSLREQFIALMRHLKLKAERKEGKIKVVPRKEFRPIFCRMSVDVQAARKSLKECMRKMHTTKEFAWVNRGATEPQFLRKRKREFIEKDVTRIHVHVYQVKDTMVEVDFTTADYTPAEARDTAIQVVKRRQNVNKSVPADNKYIAVSFVLGEEHQYEDINAIK